MTILRAFSVVLACLWWTGCASVVQEVPVPAVADEKHDCETPVRVALSFGDAEGCVIEDDQGSNVLNIDVSSPPKTDWLK